MAITAPNTGCITLADTTTTPTGMTPASVSGIGHGSTSNTGTAKRSLTADVINTSNIGGAANRPIRAVPSATSAPGANKGLRYLVVTTSTVDNAAIVAGWVNRSGETLPINENAFGVEA